jgi:D-sedoheptulose 7-phosphate isomerase
VTELLAEIVREIQESIAVKQELAGEATQRIADAARLIVASMQSGGKLIVFGNGGSAADAQHLSAELVGRYRHNRNALAAIALTTDSSALTSISNDYGFDWVFSRQLEAIGKTGDVALAISTSGNSPNVVRAVTLAKKLGIATVGLTGRSGGKLRGRVDICLSVPSDSTPRIQEAHSLIIHILSGIVEDAMVNDVRAIEISKLSTVPKYNDAA